MWRWLLVIGLFGCGTDAPDVAPTPPPTPEVAPTLPDAPAPPSSAWPARVRSLREAVDDFTSVEACRAELRERTPTAVAEGLADLRYDGFFDDVCEGLGAVAEGDVARCDAIMPSPTRAGCRMRLAIVHGRPRACPDDPVIDGRMPVCVAWAARDRTLCSAAATPDAIRCRAVLDDDAETCARLPGGDRGRCEAEVRRYASALTGERPETSLPHPEMRLEVSTGGGAPTETIERDALDRGVRLRAEGCRWRVDLERPEGERSALSLGGARGSFRVELTVQAGASTPIALSLASPAAVLEARTPQRGAMGSRLAAEGEVTLERFEPRLGGAVAGRIDGGLGPGPDRVRVRGRFATYVRDLDPLDDACVAGDAP